MYAHGPLLVLDADADRNVTGYGVGGLILDIPAKSLPVLVEWTLTKAQLGAERLRGSGKDADPLLVLTEAACERYGCPDMSESERLAGRLAEGRKVIKAASAGRLAAHQAGAGAVGARIYRPAGGGRRQCAQLCIPRRALDGRTWGHAAQLETVELARVLGVYAQRVMTPVGSAAVTGLQLMTALNPPTCASEPDADGRRHSEHRSGSLGTQPLDPAPCEATDGHPGPRSSPPLPRARPRREAVRGGLRLGAGPDRRRVHEALPGRST